MRNFYPSFFLKLGFIILSHLFTVDFNIFYYFENLLRKDEKDADILFASKKLISLDFSTPSSPSSGQLYKNNQFFKYLIIQRQVVFYFNKLELTKLTKRLHIAVPIMNVLHTCRSLHYLTLKLISLKKINQYLYFLKF